MKELIAKLISKESKLKYENVLDLIEVPKDQNLGDYAFPCFSLSKELKKNPVEIAKDLSSKISSKEFEKIESKGPYLNFFINRINLAENTINKILKEKEKYGSSSIGKGKKALVEHTSINPNASPHMGRSRNAMIGDSIVRMFKFQGFNTEAHYFVNDVGKQIAMLVLGSKGKKNIKFDDLLQLYVNINKKVSENPELEKEVFDLLNKFENGNSKVINEFKKIVDICIQGQRKILEELNIKFDFFDYESEYLRNKKLPEILKKFEKLKKTFVDEEGRIILDLKGFNLPLENPVMPLTRSDKTSLYPLRDIAYTLYKLSINQDHNIIVLGEDQKTYFREIAAALDILGLKAPKPIHYSFVLLTDGKMSTREGNVVLLEDFLKEAVSKAKEEISKREKLSKIELDKRAKTIAYSAVKYSLLKISSEKNVIFDLERALSFEGDTGPYLLYSYARAKSILRKLKSKNKFVVHALSDKEKQLVLELSKFEHVITSAHNQLAPNLIANYSYDIAQMFNEFYHSSQVIGSEEESFRLALVEAFSIVLKNSLSLLGIDVVEKM